MNRPQKRPLIHKHFHYHYHYDMNQEPEEIYQFNNPSQNRNLQQSFNPQHDSWKNHINPQVTRLYQEISESQSVHDDNRDHTFNYSYAKPIESVNYQNHSTNQYPYISPSRQKLRQEIEQYEQYLRSRSPQRYQIPKKVSFIQTQNSQNQQNPKYQSIKKSSQEMKSLDDFIRKKADSKIFHSIQSTTAKGDQLLETVTNSKNYILKKNEMPYNLGARSQIKSPQKKFGYQKAKMGFSHIDSNKKQNFGFDENYKFSTFQCLVNQESYNQDTQNSRSVHQNQDVSFQQKSQQKQDYRYELVKEECQFLRNKFIEHIQIIHGIKF